MLLYCPKCQNLITKTDDEKKEGEIIPLVCQQCQSEVSFYVKYKAISSLVKSRFDNKPDLR